MNACGSAVTTRGDVLMLWIRVNVPVRRVIQDSTVRLVRTILTLCAVAAYNWQLHNQAYNPASSHNGNNAILEKKSIVQWTDWLSLWTSIVASSLILNLTQCQRFAEVASLGDFLHALPCPIEKVNSMGGPPLFTVVIRNWWGCCERPGFCPNWGLNEGPWGLKAQYAIH